MQDYIKDRVLMTAEYILANKTTLRATAKIFMVSKSTVHTDMSIRLLELDKNLYQRVHKVLDYNFSVRHIRGGESTCLKYKSKHRK